jgi:hypothetical protein
MRVAIMQPTFLPWSGYFHLMTEVDCFVFLDDVQLQKPSWQTRNRILFRGEPHFLTLPTRGSRHQLISETRLADEPFREKHLEVLRHAYGKHPHGALVLSLLRDVYADRTLSLLADLNERFIRSMARLLQISPTFVRASELMASGKRSTHLLELLERLGSRNYLSARGSAAYIEEEGVLEEAGVAVVYQDYPVRPYAQLGTSEFVSHLSILDVLAHLGPEATARYVRAREPAEPEPRAALDHARETRAPAPP